MKVLRPGDSTANKWRYVQPETGAVFTGLSYWQVRDSVYRHRAAMKLDTEAGWEERFQDEICQQNEQAHCDRGKKARSPGKKSLTVGDLRRFMTTLSRQEGSFVSQEEAERRALICSTCPKNQTISGCWGCGGIIKAVTEYLGNKRTSRDKALESCSVCGCVLRAKVWLELGTIDNSGLEYPEHCWQKKADQEQTS